MPEYSNVDIRCWSGPAEPPEPHELADRYALSELAKIYALGIDIRDYELCRSAFSPDAQAEGRSGILTSIDLHLPNLYRAAAAFHVTQHNITNQYIALNGDEAIVWSYAVAYHKAAPGDGRDNITVGVRYCDTCRRYARVWLIAERRSMIQWSERSSSGNARGKPSRRQEPA